MQRTFEAIAQPFQTGEVTLPAGISPQTGIVALTPPQELRRALTEIDGAYIVGQFHGLGDALSHDLVAHALLARSVSAEIGRLGRRGAGLTLLASVVLGPTLGVGSMAYESPTTDTTVIATQETTVVANATDTHISEPRATAALAGIGLGAGALVGFFVGRSFMGNFAQRKARTAIERAQAG